ncbi:calcium-binding protein [Salmonella enterica]|nr:calcium-binding protein [Salmonella enterica]EAX3609109.1 calcium-binding protein [Salmonella enterica]EGW6282681.1 calcium-binding protein [Salmonella enterica]EGX3935070.1 calcium-binding protein [Salmonella enterica]
MNSEKDIIIKTFQNNVLNMPWKGTTVSVDGQDIIFKNISGDVIRLPFAAQLISISSGESTPVFEVTFSDGVKLDAGNVLGEALKNLNENDGVLSVNKNSKKEDQSNTNDEDTTVSNQNISESGAKEKIIVKEVVIEKTVENQEAGNSQENKVYDIVNQEYTFEDTAVYKIKPILEIFSSSSSSEDTKKFDHQKTESIPVDLNYPDSVALYQLATQYDSGSNTLFAGGGSRNIFDFQHQYGKQTIDMSSKKDGMTFDASIRGSFDHSTQLTKIINLGDGYNVTSFTNENNEHFRIVVSDSDEGRQFGLKNNEFAIVYDTSSNYEFTLPLKAEKDGTEYDYNIGFKVQNVDNSESIIDSSGYFLLGNKPSPLVIKGTSAGDLFNAGYGDDVYDGGEGSDTISWLGHNEGINVDFSSSQRIDEILSSNDINSENSASIVYSSREQIISGFENIIGTSYNDKFTIYGNKINISAGDGDDTFVVLGGQGLNLDGGAGNNNIDFSKLEQTGTLKKVTYGNNSEHLINGVEINLSDGEFSFNSNNENFSGKINNISEIKGTMNNDLIIGSDSNDIISSLGGSDIIYGSSGDDIINGGEGGSILDYSNLNYSVKIDLIKHESDKGDFGKDIFSNINTIVGAKGGGTITSDGVGANIVASGGTTLFSVKHGYYTMTGSNDQNIYSIDKSITNIIGKGTDEITVSDSVINYNGTLAESSVLNISSGMADIITGKGKSFIDGENNAVITINTSNGGELTYKSSGAKVSLWLDDITATTLDYSSFMSGINTILDTGKINAGDVTDEIFSGHISRLIGSSNGFNKFDAANTNYNLSLIADGSNNTFISGSGKNNHFEIISDNGSNNILDYSKVNITIHVDLNNDLITKGADGAQGSDDVINFNHILGSKGNGNTYIGKVNTDTFFDIKYGSNQTVYAKEGGNDTYILKNGNTDTLLYNSLDHSINYSQSGVNNKIQKGDGHSFSDSVNYVASNIYATNFDDTFNIYATKGSQNIYAGRGDDIFNLGAPGTNGEVINYYGGEGNNVLNYTGSQGQVNFVFTDSNTVKTNNVITVHDISSFNHSGNGSAKFTWANTADDINLHIDRHNNNSHFDFIIREGNGNTIDGGAGATKDNYSKVDYSLFTQGIVADLNKSVDTVVSADGRHSDNLTNINSIVGTDFNDSITGSNEATYFYASGGNDNYNGMSGNDWYNTIHTSILNLEDLTINKNVKGVTGLIDTVHDIHNFNLSAYNDIIEFSDSIANNFFINAGNGTDTLKQSQSGSIDVALGDLSNIQNIEILDLSKVDHDSIKFDLDGYFKQHTDKSSLNLKVSHTDAANRDIFDFKTDPNNTWSLHNSNGNHHVYIDNNLHQLVVDVV